VQLKLPLGLTMPMQPFGSSCRQNPRPDAAIGTTDPAFYDGLIGYLVNASNEGGPSDFMLLVVKGFRPQDQVEAMVAAQTAAVHMASMTFAGRIARHGGARFGLSG
jgi:hypothetical protein